MWFISDHFPFGSVCIIDGSGCIIDGSGCIIDGSVCIIDGSVCIIEGTLPKMYPPPPPPSPLTHTDPKPTDSLKIETFISILSFIIAPTQSYSYSACTGSGPHGIVVSLFQPALPSVVLIICACPNGAYYHIIKLACLLLL